MFFLGICGNFLIPRKKEKKINVKVETTQTFAVTEYLGFKFE